MAVNHCGTGSWTIFNFFRSFSYQKYGTRANLYYGTKTYFGRRFQRGRQKFLTKRIRGHGKFQHWPPLISRSRITIKIDQSLRRFPFKWVKTVMKYKHFLPLRLNELHLRTTQSNIFSSNSNKTRSCYISCEESEGTRNLSWDESQG